MAVGGRRSGWRLRAALFLGVGLGLTAAVLIAYGTNVFRELEDATLDARFAVRGPERPTADIVLVQLDEESFGAIDLNVIPRTDHAAAIDRIARDRPRVIAYDFQFTEQSDDPAADNALIESVQRAGKVVLATTEVDEKGRTNVFGGNIPRRARAANANFSPDQAGVLRRLPHSVHGLETFAVATAELATGRPVPSTDFSGRAVWIDYHGPPGMFPAVPFAWVSRGQTPLGFFEDKIVVVGASATTLHDLHSTPTGENMSGTEVQANAISTVLRGLPLRSAPRELNVALIVLLGLLAPLVSLFAPLRWTLAAAVAAAGVFLVATQLAFQTGTVVSFVYPFGALVLSTIGSIGAHYLLAAFERERVRGVFSRFVPDTVVEQVLARTDGDRLGGVELVGTAMFTDLRGFTSFAESLPAPQVIDILNVYLTEMSDAILSHGGTLVAYMGDGIFAVFGAPIEQPDHADRALAAAREMLNERLPRFNAFVLREHGNTGFRMGIGLNSGPFLSGNVGSERRMEYAAIGDTTNTAARLEGMTKGTSYQCYVAGTTRQALTGEAEDLLYVDEVEIRGRKSKVLLWALPDPDAAADKEPEPGTAVAESALH